MELQKREIINNVGRKGYLEKQNLKFLNMIEEICAGIQYL